ncbi:neutral amino acid transporter 9-like [Saccoglossus kowalevskii]
MYSGSTEAERKPLLSIQVDLNDVADDCSPRNDDVANSNLSPAGHSGKIFTIGSVGRSSLSRAGSYNDGQQSSLSRAGSYNNGRQSSYTDERKSSRSSSLATDDYSRTRKPFHYVPSSSSINSSEITTEEHQRASATYSRYKYYSKLSPPQDDTLAIPDHIVPPSFFLLLPGRAAKGKQSSIVTIFSVWNTMMGTSLLSMPWAIGEAGLILGIVILIVMAGLTLYTCYRVVSSVAAVEQKGEVLEFSDVCHHYLGKWGEYCSVFFSLSSLLGAMIVYWVLLSNFLYHSVKFIYDDVNHVNMSSSGNVTDGILCPGLPPYVPPTPSTNITLSLTTQSLLSLDTSSNAVEHNSEDVFNKVWQQTLTIPFFLCVLLFPLLNFKSPTFFTKFNALGTVCVIYILSFVTVKAAHWGINVKFTSPNSKFFVPIARQYFPAFTGTLALAYFIHNGILSILRGQKHPENNGRDLSISYILVALTYTWVGVLFYISFPNKKECIEANLLDNFPSNDVMAFVARICLLIQMITVFPLLIYIFRLQFMHTLFGAVYPGIIHVGVLNICVLAICVLFAIFLPQIGTIIR